MSEHKRNRNGKGYYIALVLCAAAIWIKGYVYFRSTNQLQEASLEETYEDVLVGTLGTEDVPVLATQPQTEGTTEPTMEATKPPKRSLKTSSPVSGEEVYGYSMEALSYNQTTRDWRVHNGMDIAAAGGTEVCAAADGEVYTVYEDDSMGYTVVIRHEGGYTTKYASLAADVSVSAGQPVSMGQTIGAVGTTALMENALGDHVHFCVTKDDRSVDPMTFLE
jgi:murein DD-endopeptidase MepM/ murein hydrolase activator NlpD